MLGEEINDNAEGIEELLPEDICSFKFASAVSCDIERSFSKYKSMLLDNRRNSQFESQKLHFVTSYWYWFKLIFYITGYIFNFSFTINLTILIFESYFFMIAIIIVFKL